MLEEVRNTGAKGGVSSWSKRHPLVFWSCAFVLLPILIIVGVIYDYFSDSVVKGDQQVSVAGIHAPIELSRDEQGTLYINAQTDVDVFFAMGYAQAQDRLWQLELQRRMVKGELSEIFGKNSLPFDIFVRTLGLYQASKDSWAALDKNAQASLEAYARGVNAWLEEAPRYPSEFILLDIEPQPWSALDSLAWVKMFALSLGMNYRTELDNLLLSEILPAPKLAALTGIQPRANTKATSVAAIQEQAMDVIAKLSGLSHSLELDWQLTGSAIGSNAWAVAPNLTLSGNTVLANDPHVGLELPSGWYAVRAKGKTLDVSGMSLVGLPIVMLGRNDRIAWGAANMMADSQDLFFEQLSPLDQNKYLLDGTWKNLEVREEQIKVKADFPAFLREPLKPVNITIRRTQNGPLVSDIVGATDQHLALRWVGSQTNDTSYQAFFDLNYASNWQSFRSAMAQHIAPAMNLVYADVDNNIGYLGIGKIPLRGTGKGKFPLAGWESKQHWQGYIPVGQMPSRFNPDEGYVVAANNNMLASDYPYFVSDDWAAPARAKRITELLRAVGDGERVLDLSDHKAIQLDQIDTQALAVLPHLLSVSPQTETQSDMLTYMNDWKGQTDQNSIASSIFFLWVHHLKSLLFDDELKHDWGNLALTNRMHEIVSDLTVADLNKALEENTLDWCDDQQTTAIETCEQKKLEALNRAFDDLTLILGQDMDDWEWSELHHTLFAHRPFSSVRGLDFLYEREVANGGSLNSVNVSGATFIDNTGFVQSFGAGFRQIMELAPMEQSRHLFVNSTGQSGNVFSAHYDDMIEPFIQGEYFELLPAQPQFISTLKLTPMKEASQ